MQRRAAVWVGWLLVLGVLLTCGLAAGARRAACADSELRAEWTATLTDFARTIDPALVRRLRFKAEDRGNPAYAVLRQQMLVAGKPLHARGIYSIASRDGEYLFGPEDYAVDDPHASPPGTRYVSPPPQLEAVFRQGRAVAVGPYTDEFGSFVSAFAPVTDPHTGEVLLVVGMDLPAEAWHAAMGAARLGPVLRALALLLVLIGAAAAVGWYNRQRADADLCLRRWVVVPVALAMLAGLAVYVYDQTRQSDHQARHDVARATKAVKSAWSRALSERAQLFAALLLTVSRDARVREAWTQQDLARLRLLAEPLFQKFGATAAVTHWSFSRPDGTVALRLDQPTEAGDGNRRDTFQRAAATGLDAWGIETTAGRGVATLVYVHPWQVDGRTVGYLELGTELSTLCASLDRDSDTDVVLALRKAVTDAERYHAGRERFGLTGRWDDYPSLVVLHQSGTALPDGLVAQLRRGEPVAEAGWGMRCRQAGRVCEVASSPVLASDGTVVGSLIVLRDVTSQAGEATAALVQSVVLALVFFAGVLLLLSSITGRAERQMAGAFQRVQRSEATLRRVFDGSPDACLIIVGERFVDCNAAAEKMFAAGRDELLGLRPADVSPAFQPGGRASDDAAPEMVAAALAAGNHGFEWRHRRLDGSEFWAEVSLSRVAWDGQEGIFVALRDLTRRHQAEAALRQSEARLRAITDAAQDAIVMIDADGCVSHWNPAAERIFGYRGDEALGRPLHDFLAPPQYRAAHAAAWPSFQAHGQGVALGRTLELTALHRDGTEIPIELSLSAVQFDGAWHAIGLLRDISDRKRAEAELLDANRRLAAATQEAQQLAVRAEQASAAKSEFLANMSHEIRTPMNGVIGMTGLLLDTALTDEQRRYAEIVRSSADSLLLLINDILDFSKIEAGKLDLEVIDFDLRAMLDDFAATMALRAHAQGLELIFWIDPAAPTLLRGDPGRLRQVLTNLVGNAIKFTHEGEVAVRVAVADQTPTEVLLQVAVRDTGIGIARDSLENLFESFTQVDASTTRKYGGTGLGLAICRQLVELMDGEISVDSEPGRGSVFFFTARLAKQAVRESSTAARRVTLSGQRVLVVDDNETNREVLRSQLVARGLRVDEAADGEAGLLALRQAAGGPEAYELAILDMQMPGLDGEALGRRIRSEPALAGTRLLLMTSLGQRGDGRRVEACGFDGYLTKPVAQAELYDVVAAVLRGASQDAGQPKLVTRHRARELRPSTARVLLAEDNPVNQQVALALLAKVGLRADAVANGAEAIRALEQVRYDLVLMDIQMPELDGLSATRQIRSPASAVLRRDVPIVAMTAHAMQGDRESCLAAGMDDYLTKPLDPALLAEMLHRWLPADGLPAAPRPVALTQNKPAGRPQAPVLDTDDLNGRLLGDVALVSEILEAFLTDTPGQLEQLRACVAAGERDGAQRRAHAIQGAAANVSAGAMRLAAKEIEEAAAAGRVDDARALLPALEASFEEVCAAVIELTAV